MTPQQAENARREAIVERLISRLLRAGVLTSILIVTAGLILSFVHHPAWTRSPAELHGLLHPRSNPVDTVPGVLRYAQRLRGRGFVMAGLLVLIATPVMRVALSIFGFAFQRDRVFVVITSTVLVLLLASFLLGRAGG